MIKKRLPKPVVHLAQNACKAHWCLFLLFFSITKALGL
jgi:hypothetical protein